MLLTGFRVVVPGRFGLAWVFRVGVGIQGFRVAWGFRGGTTLERLGSASRSAPGKLRSMAC